VGLCVNLGYEVVTSTIHVGVDSALRTVRVTAPAGKKPLSGGFKNPWSTSGSQFTANNLVASYPDGNDWVFQFQDISYTLNGYDVDLYVVCVNV
jgi:hypothetical protein